MLSIDKVKRKKYILGVKELKIKNDEVKNTKMIMY